jgi:3,5-epimerase/4-reductase
MNNDILVWGKGFLGTRIAEHLKCASTGNRIRKYSDIKRVFDEYRPNTIINCIGHTGKNNTDDCDKRIDKTLSANTFVPILFAEAAFRLKFKLVHISSGCMYHTTHFPINEFQTPNFFDLFYSRTKIYSEKAIELLARDSNVLILKVRIPLDYFPHKKNLLTKLIKYRKVIDIPNSVTYIPDFLDALIFLLALDARGTFNIVAKGGCQYPTLMQVYKSHNPKFKYTVYPADEFQNKYVRTNLILSTEKIEKLGFRPKPIDAIYDECVKFYRTFEVNGEKRY